MAEEPLDTLIAKAKAYVTKSDQHLKSAALTLVEIKNRVEAGDPDAKGLGWTAYATTQLPFSWSYTKKLIKVGISDDIDKAIATLRASSRESSKKSRQNRQAPAQEPSLNKVWADFEKLPLDDQWALIERASDKLNFSIRKRMNRAA